MHPLTHRIHLLGQALSSSAEKILRAEFEIGFSDFLCLLGVARNQLPSQTELARFVGVSEAGISRIVTRLVEQNLIIAETDSANRRRSQIALSATGSKLVEKADALLEERFGRSIGHLATSEDLAAFERVLDALLTKLKS